MGDIAGDAAACRKDGVAFVFAAYGFGRVDAPGFASFEALRAHLLGRVRPGGGAR